MSTLVGSQLKFAISLSLPSHLTMDDVDWNLRFYCYFGRFFLAPKGDCVRIDSNTYEVVVDTGIIGDGDIIVDAEVLLPTLGGGYRTEFVSYKTGLKTVRNGLR